MPTVTVNNTTVCAGSPATLTATPGTPGGTYLWSPGGANTQNITVSPSTTTTYTVTYTLGCEELVLVQLLQIPHQLTVLRRLFIIRVHFL